MVQRLRCEPGVKIYIGPGWINSHSEIDLRRRDSYQTQPSLFFFLYETPQTQPSPADLTFHQNTASFSRSRISTKLKCKLFFHYSSDS